jgi:hypothetical protein
VFGADDTACAAPLLELSSPEQCVQVNPAADKLRVGAAISGDGKCTPSGGMSQGSVTAQKPITVCCQYPGKRRRFPAPPAKPSGPHPFTRFAALTRVLTPGDQSLFARAFMRSPSVRQMRGRTPARFAGVTGQACVTG